MVNLEDILMMRFEMLFDAENSETNPVIKTEFNERGKE